MFGKHPDQPVVAATKVTTLPSATELIQPKGVYREKPAYIPLTEAVARFRKENQVSNREKVSLREKIADDDYVCCVVNGTSLAAVF